MLLHPDDLGPDLESAGLQAQRHLGGMNAGMPDVGDVARKQRPSLRPIDPIVVGDLAALAGPRVETRLLAPLRFEINAIRGIGHHEKRGLLPASSRVVASLAVASPHNTRCCGRPLRWPNSQRSPGLVTGAAGTSGTSSSSDEPRGSLMLGQSARQFLVVETEQI